jgi:manganese/zinc/iron transport system permease protein
VVATAWRQARLRLAYAEQAALTSVLHGRFPPSRRMESWLKFRGMVRDGALTTRGIEAARAAERNRRLWERFLIHYPTLVPGRANWGIDPIDRVLPRDLVLELESFPEALSP